MMFRHLLRLLTLLLSRCSLNVVNIIVDLQREVRSIRCFLLVSGLVERPAGHFFDSCEIIHAEVVVHGRHVDARRRT